MRFERQVLIIISAMALITSCASSASAPAVAPKSSMMLMTKSVAHSGWWLRVCPRQTETSGIELTIGTDAQHTTAMTWKSGDPIDIDVTPEYRKASALYVHLLVPDRRIAHLCVIDTDTSRKQVVTDGEATVTVANTETEMCACYP